MPAAEPDNQSTARRHSATALAIRSYFGARFVEWAKRPRATLAGGVTVDNRKLMAAVFNLCNYMRADGKLLDGRGHPRGIDGEHGLAAIMGVHRETAMRIFKGLEAEGCMRSRETRDDNGYRQPEERWLQVPEFESLSRPPSARPDLGVVRTQVGEVASLSRRSGGPKSGHRIAAPTQHLYGREEEKEEKLLPADAALPAAVSHGSQPRALPSVVRESNHQDDPITLDGRIGAAQRTHERVILWSFVTHGGKVHGVATHGERASTHPRS